MHYKYFIALLILSISIGVLHWHYGLFHRYNYFTAKSDIARQHIQIVSIGLPRLNASEFNGVTYKYGFKILNFGCMVSTSEENGIAAYNRQMYRYLDTRHGSEWRVQYQSDIKARIQLNNIPKTAFWVGDHDTGHWFNVDWMHAHRNNAKISIYDKTGLLVTQKYFVLYCTGEDVYFLHDLQSQIEFYDGKDIQLKHHCFLRSKEKPKTSL